MTTPLRSGPVTEPSTLLRAPPPLCPASVLGPSRRLTAWVSPFASGRQVPVFLTEACLEVTPPSCRTPVGPSAGLVPTLARGTEIRSRFRRRLNTLRHVISGIAVENRVAPVPPHRSERARFGHSAP